MELPQTIAIDGPAASGKSTLAQHLARRLGYLYLDTGVMYRAATLAALEQGISIGDEVQIGEMAESLTIDVRAPTVEDGRPYDVILDGDDVTWRIRSVEVDASVSVVSQYPRVRSAMTVRQQAIGARGRVVMVGRDIGTVVLPQADLKIYLDASVEERARRRHEELKARKVQSSYDEILASMRARDQLDESREHAPLRAAGDAHIIDTTGLSIDEVLARSLDLVERWSPRNVDDG